MSIYPDKICHLQLNFRQIILFRLKSHHFRTYLLLHAAYMISYNNVSRLVHDPSDRPPQPKIWRVVMPQPPMIDAYERMWNCVNTRYNGSW